MSDSKTSSPGDFAWQLVQHLESLQRAGVTHLTKADPAVAMARLQAAIAQQAQADLAPPTEQPAPEQPPVNSEEEVAASPHDEPQQLGLFQNFSEPTVPQPPAATVLTREQRVEALQVLQAEVAKCTQCSELASSRTQTVFGVGNPQPKLVFFGEAPGADEDRLGEPFVGRAGELLNRIIAACTLGREEVYILNTLKCRPPGNRNPEPDEIRNCRPFWQRQLEILQPEYICCLGAFTAQTLLETDLSVGRLRGKLHRYRNAKVVCTYHPSYLLRTPEAKKKTWDDMKLLLRDMGINWEKK